MIFDSVFLALCLEKRYIVIILLISIIYLSNVIESESVSHSICPTLSDPVDYNLLGSSVPGILQARILE